MANALQLFHAEGSLLLVADGFNGDAKQAYAALPAGEYRIAGCLAGGDLHQARTFQIGGRQAGIMDWLRLITGNLVIEWAVGMICWHI
jgi:hypothetical protein